MGGRGANWVLRFYLLLGSTGFGSARFYWFCRFSGVQGSAGFGRRIIASRLKFLAPGPDVGSTLTHQAPRDLRNVGEVVSAPASQELRERHDAKLRVHGGALTVGGGQSHRVDVRDICRAQLIELVEQL